ncbi:hypothetical protein [Nodularia sp. UHCC 0506]|uniref:hypothetical protein n=1 Tax=Nodularia sp. UHCC 0506 TaxID=3110243 RepID=UPI002B21699E|nr:hypothetical protein [Nodularia sp. UHCC 0506]MEA5516748.1 hypothetical protein [Nodularia sp. UHCC 0506]
MASITISDLHPAGADLFLDSESYMNELQNADLDNVHGGFSSPWCAAAIKAAAVGSPGSNFVCGAVIGFTVGAVIVTVVSGFVFRR